MKIALFDLDHTLLPFDSDHAWGAFTERLGWVDAESFRRRNDAFYEDYKARKLDIAAYVAFSTAAIRRQGMAAALTAREAFMEEVVRPHLLPQARAVVDRHIEAGDTCLMVTATNDFVTAPIAKELGIPHLIATTLERTPDGDITGRISGQPAYQHGKVERVAQWLEAHSQGWASLDDSTFYSDSLNDLPLLEQVRHPVATNPEAGLEAIARERDWPVLKLFS